MSMPTSAAPIHGPVSFVGKSDAFDAASRTEDGPLDVPVPKLPVGAALSLNARASNDVTNLVLPSSFEVRIW